MYASKAGGTWMSGLQNENWRKLELDSSADFSTWKFCESSHTGIFNRLKLQDIASRSSIPYKPVRLDSQVKYAMVARGDVQLYLRPPRHSRSGELIWDHAAGDIIVREAGGVVCDFDGKPLDYCQGRYVAGNQGIVAFDGKYYNRIMAAILNK